MAELTPQERLQPSLLDRLTDLGWADVFVFFKHEDGGTGPALAARMLEMHRSR